MRALLLATLAHATLLSSPVAAEDWPSRLGPSADGRSAATGVFSGRPQVALTKVWSHGFDGGRAGIAVAGGRVVTLLNQDEHDFAVAWDAASGRELWRVDLGETHPDQYLGPGSTPVLDATRAFVIGSTCQLRALDAASGRALWTVDLKARFTAAPRQGCSSSPVIHEGRLIVQTAGAAGQPQVAAFDPATGELSWQAPMAERAPYSSPLVATVAGLPQILVHHVKAPSQVGGLTALDPKTGAVLWAATPEASKGASFESPLLLDGDRVGLSTWNDFSVQQVQRADGAWRVNEVWRSTDFSAWVSPPVAYKGHLYGFGGDELACVDAATGKLAWKEKLYGGSLILVDGHLVVLSQAAGLVRVVEATPSGYREKARLEVLNRGARAEAPPSFAGGRIFVRSDDEIAALTIS